jgi:competence protein ComEA
VPDLLRPEPPRSWAERLTTWRVAWHPARLAVAAGLVLLLGAGGWWLLRPPATPVEDGLPRASSATRPPPAATIPVPEGAAPPPSSTVTPALLVVQVAGAVAHPGVYRLADGARVVDLVRAAGGAAADADLQAMSLAARLVDGERVQVPRHGELLPAELTGGAPALVGPAGAARGTSTTAAPAPVDLNTATPEELDALPGVGPATARAIVTYREQHGPFSSVDALTDVPGIGPAKLDALRDLVRA